MIIKKIKDQLLEARKSKNELVKNLLSVALGDIQLQGSRPGQNGEVTDQQAEKIVHKLMKSNEETMRVASPELARKLQLENEILSALLPKACTKEEMKVCLFCALEQIKAAKSDGQATGVAMKFLAVLEGSKDGKLVSEIVKELRNCRTL